MDIPTRELTADDHELIEFARQVVDANTDGRVILPTEQGLRSVRITDLMPLAARWTMESGSQPFDPELFTDQT